MTSIRSDLHEAVTFPLSPGIPVLTADGRELGLVKEIAETAFKVDAPMRTDYWLARRDILSTSAERVTMDFPTEAVDEFRLKGPEEAPPLEPDPVIAAGHPLVMDEDEQLEQRERMEREMEEQRKHLPNAN